MIRRIPPFLIRVRDCQKIMCHLIRNKKNLHTAHVHAMQIAVVLAIRVVEVLLNFLWKLHGSMYSP